MLPILKCAAVAALSMPIAGCGAVLVTNAVVGTTVAATTVVTKTAVGAATIAVKGTGAAIHGTGRAISSVAGSSSTD